MTASYPSGVVTLAFTDIEGSSELWAKHQQVFQPTLEQHNAIIRAVAARHNGLEVKTIGDAFFLVFEDAGEAAQWAVEVQKTLGCTDWPQPVGPLCVRIGLHSGAALLTQHPNGSWDYFGPPVNITARVEAAAHGGQILLSDSVRALAAPSLPPAITLQSLGLQRLKGVGEVELYQVCHPDLPRDFPPPNTMSRKINLPVPGTPYVGREAELAEWQALLEKPDTRLLTLTAFGGMGKTRTALHLAELVSDNFKDGVWWVELEEAHSQDDVIQRIARGLRYTIQPQPSIREQVMAYLQSKSLLLVLDNTEQAPEAGKIVKSLLDAAPDVKMLVTTRYALELQAERIVTLAPLPEEEAERLLVERVRARKPDFEITDVNRADVRELCRRLEGIPLAIELATARMSGQTPREIVKRLNERFKILTTRAPELPERQRALRAAIDWSYDLLTDDDKTVFAQLSVFAGGFTMEDAEAVCDAFDVYESVMELRRHSFFRVETDPKTQATRFIMLDSIREYAADKLGESGDAITVHQRHAEYFLHYAQERIGKMRTAKESEALAELEQNAANLRVAQDSAKEGDDPVLYALLAYLRGVLLLRRGFALEAVEPIEAALEACEPIREEQSALYSRILRERAGLHFDTQEYEDAEARAREALALAESAGDRRDIARLHNLLAEISRVQENFPEAREGFQRALSALQNAREPIETAIVFNNFGLLEAAAPDGSREQARQYLEQALALRKKHQDRRGLAETANNLGVLAQEQEAWDEAETFYNEALQHEQEVRHTFGMARALYNLAEVAQSRQRLEVSCRLAAASERLMNEVQSPYEEYAADLLISAAAGLPNSEARVAELRAQAQARAIKDLIAWAQTPTDNSRATPTT